MKGTNKFEQHVGSNHNAIKHVTKIAQTSTHLTYITTLSST